LHFRTEEDAQRWLETMEKRLEQRIPDRKQRLEVLRTCSTRRRARASIRSSCSG
jgi:phage shock protein A